MRPLTDKARCALDLILEAFDSPEKFVDTLARATLIPNNSPCARWGPYNRFLVALRGTSDARGFRQWQEANRHVKKGARALHILVPRFKKVQEDDPDGDEKGNQILIGFVAAAVFAAEDTEGDPLPEATPREIPQLQAVADYLGIPVRYASAV
jgi:hypothetical protein